MYIKIINEGSRGSSGSEKRKLKIFRLKEEHLYTWIVLGVKVSPLNE